MDTALSALEILYVGSSFKDEVSDIAARGAVFHDATTIYAGIAKLKRSGVGAVLVEFAELGKQADAALKALREAAGSRPVLVSMTMDEWEIVRPTGLVSQAEVLLRPYYPDELWRRVTSAALPPPAQAAASFRGDADRLQALMEDSHRLNRFTNDLQAMADQCVSIVKARLRAGRVSLFLKTKEPGKLTIAHTAGIDKEVRDHATVRLGEGVAGEIAQRKRIALVKEAGRDGPTSSRPYKQTSYMIVPLVREPDVVGVLCITDRFEQGPFTDEDLEYMRAFAAMTGQTVANALQFRAADELATIDEGTRLFNRRFFNRVLPQEVVRATRYKHDLTLAMIDVDYFKQYNDSMGHQAGDRALARVAEILRESFRESDMVVRYGGEEFAVIMPETSRKEGNGVGFVDRARAQVEAAGLMFQDRQGNERPLTISGGVATLPLQAQSWEELVEKADRALYKAKSLGRNRIIGW